MVIIRRLYDNHFYPRMITTSKIEVVIIRGWMWLSCKDKSGYHTKIDVVIIKWILCGYHTRDRSGYHTG